MKRITTTLLVTAVLVGLTWLWPSSHAATRSVELQGPVMRAHFVNVGQANATLLEFPCGVALVDAGAQDDEHSDDLVDFITSVFDARPELNSTLEAVYVTHNHLDHNAALRAVAEKFKVKRYFDNGNLKGSGKPNTKWIRKNKNTEGRNIHVREIKDSAIPSPTDEGLTDDEIDPIQCADCDPKISILWASPATRPEGWSKSDFKEENNHSLVIRVQFGASTFLFPGDMQDAAIESLVERYEGKPTLDVDVLEVSHHGAENGTTADLLEALTPKIAVLSVGRADFGEDDPSDPMTTFAFGHPRRVTVDLLSSHIQVKRKKAVIRPLGIGQREFRNRKVSKSIYATAWDGNIEVQADLAGMLVVNMSNN